MTRRRQPPAKVTPCYALDVVGFRCTHSALSGIVFCAGHLVYLRRQSTTLTDYQGRTWQRRQGKLEIIDPLDATAAK